MLSSEHKNRELQGCPPHPELPDTVEIAAFIARAAEVHCQLVWAHCQTPVLQGLDWVEEMTRQKLVPSPLASFLRCLQLLLSDK